jgi:succinate-acetate transporter protein
MYIIYYLDHMDMNQRFSLGTPAFSTNTTDRHDIAEILLKVALYTITPYIFRLKVKCVQVIFIIICSMFLCLSIVDFISGLSPLSHVSRDCTLEV